MSNLNNETRPNSPPQSKSISWSGVVQAVLFGLIFGFLLQKGGVAKYHILVGVLLLQEFTVIKVMMSAIIVGMVGIFVLHRLGRIELKIKPTRYGAQVVGGLIFGAGFACSGYCPGTGAAALGQMNWDAIFMILGMVLGSYIFAQSSRRLSHTIEKWGDQGKVLLPDLLHARRGAFVLVLALALAAGLALLERIR